MKAWFLAMLFFVYCSMSGVQRLLAILGVSYCALRAMTLDITYDEAWTITHFLPQGWWELLTYKDASSNQHLLNTLLAKLSTNLLAFTGADQLILARLPNVMAAWLFYRYLSLFSHSLQSKVKGIFLFLILGLNPYLLDFYSLARGYGLALSFALASAWHLLQFLKTNARRDVWLYCFFGLLIVLSNFAFLLPFLSTLFIGFVFTENRRTQTPALAISALLALMISQPILRLISSGELWYGGTGDLYNDTIYSLVAYFRYEPHAVEANFLYRRFLLGGVVVLVLIASFSKIGSNQRFGKIILPLTLLITLPLLAMQVQHLWFGTKFPIDRAALYLIPFFFLFIFYCADAVSWKNASRWLEPALLVLTVFVCMNSAKHLNLTKTITWEQDARYAEVIQYLKENGYGYEDINFDWPFRAGLDYYQHRIELEHGNSEAQLYLHYAKPLPYVGYEPISADTLGILVLSFPEDGIYLFRKSL